MLRNLVYWFVTFVLTLSVLIQASESLQNLNKNDNDFISTNQSNHHRHQQDLACFVNNQQLLALAESVAKSTLQEEHRRKYRYLTLKINPFSSYITCKLAYER